MKRLCSLCLTLGMLCGAAATAGAVEIKAKGTWEILSEWSNVAPLNGPNDRFATLQRLRTQVEIISSNALKGVVFFEIGDTNWGRASEGGALGTDAKNIEVRYSYVDWQVPNTDLRVRMGLQPIILPGFVASGFSPVFGHDVAGIMLSQKWSDEAGRRSSGPGLSTATSAAGTPTARRPTGRRGIPPATPWTCSA